MTAVTVTVPAVAARRPRVVVVGNGMAGLRFVQDLLAQPPGFRITVVGDEPGGAYNRAQLPLVLAGTTRADSIELADREWYASRDIGLVTATAARIDRAAQLLELSDGTALGYDVLVLAVGSAPVLPPADGLTRPGPGSRLIPGAVAFRTLADCARIQALAAAAEHAVVLGGGVLGLETARSLSAAGRPVTLIQRGSRLMERQLDSDAARILARTARSFGITVRAGAGVSKVLGGDRLTGLQLNGGRFLPSELLVLCCGTRPRTQLAQAAGLSCGAGVIVDDQLRSITDPRIFAIGDCAEHRGRTHGLVAAAWAQARAAAEAVAAQTAAGQAHPAPARSARKAPAAISRPTTGGEATSRPTTGGQTTIGPTIGGPSTGGPATGGPTATGGPATSGPSTGGPTTNSPATSRPTTGGPTIGGPSTGGPATSAPATSPVLAPVPAVIRLKAAGIELAVLGSPQGGGGADVIRFTDPARGIYQKLVIRDGRLAGAILLGDTRTAGTLTQLLDRGTPLPADRMSLLSGRRDGAAAGHLGQPADSPVTLPGHATICQCNGVTKAAICAAWEQGARDVAQVAARTRASTGCGTCRDAVEGIVDWLTASDPSPAEAGKQDPSPRLVPA
jgi:assimilatory nitrate reductase electron transfer subunit